MTQKESKQSWFPDFPYFSAGMNLEKAVIMIEAAVKRAQKMALSFALAVCDGGGNLVALQKMDEAPLLSLEIAVNKARTAVFGKVPTGRGVLTSKERSLCSRPSGFIAAGLLFPVDFR
jgi:uncharacterized protein GlcG (DUF336 family)